MNLNTTTKLKVISLKICIWYQTILTRFFFRNKLLKLYNICYTCGMSKLVAIRFKDEVVTALEKVSKHIHRSKSSIIKEALDSWMEEYLDTLLVEQALAEDDEHYIKHEV